MSFFVALLPCLLLACAVIIPWILKLWRKELFVPTFVGGMLLLLIYLYSGIRVGESEALPLLRQIFTTSVLQNPKVLVSSCILLTIALAGALYCGAYSETLAFEPDTATEFKIYRAVYVENEEGATPARERLIGTASLGKPLVRRFFSGTIRLNFRAEGFQGASHLFDISRSWLSARERHVPVVLALAPEFGLIDVENQGGEFFDINAPEWRIPQRLKGQDMTTLTLTLAAVNKKPIRIQNLKFLVDEVSPLEKATFPVDGLGGDGEPPLLGHAELKSQIGEYGITVSKMRFEEGASPADYQLLAFSPQGFRYKIRVALRWTDLRDARQGGEHLFPETQELDFPTVLPWTDLTKGAQDVRIFYGTDLWTLHWILRLLSEHANKASLPIPRSHALLGHTSSQLLARTLEDVSENVQELEKLGLMTFRGIDDDAARTLIPHVGLLYERPRNFIVIDNHTMLVQSDEPLDEAEVIRDMEKIEAVIKAFDKNFDKSL